MRGWTTKKIKKGFDKFIEEKGRLPTAPEIDNCSYLPSARTIQRSFGGLVSLRKQLGYEQINFGKGKHRSKLAKQAYKAGLSAEQTIEEILVKKFGEPFVHTEKRVGEKKNRIDFYIYSPTSNLAIDVFSPNSFRDLQKNVNLKIDRFVNMECPLVYLAYTNVKQKKINKWIKNKRKKLPPNTYVQNYFTFEQFIKKYSSYPNPISK